MKVFLSWSGEPSHSVALALRDWLPLVVPDVEPYVSSEDIEKGKRWPDELGQNLELVNVGILCLTRTNTRSPWVIFEAGALSKSLEQSRVIPLLLGLETSAVEWPLAQFQMTRVEKQDFARMLRTINASSDRPREVGPLQTVFDRFWTDIEEQIREALTNHREKEAPTPTRTDREVLEEVLELVRSQERQLVRDFPAPPAKRLPRTQAEQIQIIARMIKDDCAAIAKHVKALESTVLEFDSGENAAIIADILYIFHAGKPHWSSCSRALR